MQLAKYCAVFTLLKCGGAGSCGKMKLCGTCYTLHLQNIKEAQEKGWEDVLYYFYYGKE